MQLKTYLSIGTGIAVGAILGMSVTENTKYRTITRIKKKIVEALTGEKWEPKRYEPPKRTTYTSYCAKPKVETKKDILDSDDPSIKTMLLFETQQEAKDTILRMDEYFHKNRSVAISVHDLAWMRGRTVDYTLDNYGWTKEEVDEAHVVEWEPDNPLLSGYKYKIEIAKAHYIS